MKRTLWLVVVSGLLACGDTTVASANGDDSTGGTSAATSANSGGPEVSSSDTTAADGGSGGSSSSAAGSSGGSESTTGAAEHCQVQVLEAVQLSSARFGALTLAQGEADSVLLGGWGWTLTGSIEAPAVERFREPDEALLAGRFGPGGGWAFAELDTGLVRVLPLDDPGAMFETATGSLPPSLVGDVNEDALDDLVIVESGTHHLWQADGVGGFSLLASSVESYPGAVSGFAPATDWAPAAVLVGQPNSGVLGLELSDDVLAKAYAVEVGFVWSMQGVLPSAGAGRSLLVAREGGVAIDPLVGWVGFLDGVDGEWTRRGVELGQPSSVAPQALDLDGDDVLDAVAATSNALRGACSVDDALVPCLEAPLTGTPESIAAREDGIVFVATEDDGLWAYPLGACL